MIAKKKVINRLYMRTHKAYNSCTEPLIHLTFCTKWCKKLVHFIYNYDIGLNNVDAVKFADFNMELQSPNPVLKRAQS